MAKRREVPFEGKNIYYDKRNRSIYYNKRTKTGYVIPAERQAEFRNYSMRYMVAIIAGIFVYYFFNHNIFFSLGAVLFVGAFMSYRYYRLLKAFTRTPNYNIEGATPSIQVKVDKQSRNMLLIRAILMIALAILLVANILVTESLRNDIVIIIGSGVVAVYALYQAFLSFKKLSIK